MIDQHSITPSEQLLKSWWCRHTDEYESAESFDVLLTEAYQAGADQELEECWRWMRDEGYRETAQLLHSARRPKPPSLKEQALRDLDALAKDLERNGMGFGTAMIRRALEALPND